MIVFIALLFLAGISYLFGKKELSRKLQKMALWWVVIAFVFIVIVFLIGVLVSMGVLESA